MEAWLEKLKTAYLGITLTEKEKQRIWLNIINSVKTWKKKKRTPSKKS